MNQEKIGKFIANCRKKLNITQQDLANKLGVTDKAVSKWENGRSLMDISLLKPLSEILQVSIIELINGEKIKDNYNQQNSNGLIEYTLCYTKEKIIKSKIKTILSVIIIVLLLMVIAYISYKGIMLKKYTVEQLYEYDNIVENLNFINTLKIDKKTINETEYLVLPEFKLRNDFLDFSEVKELKHYEKLKYLKYDENNDLEAAFFVFKDNNLIEKFRKNFDNIPIGEDAVIIDDDRENFLLKNDINNDIELLNYINQHYYLKNNIFTSVRKMIDNYNINSFAQLFPDIKRTTKIIGDYEGYIFDLQGDIREVHILKNNKDYIFTFIGEDMIRDDYIIDLLSTLEIK